MDKMSNEVELSQQHIENKILTIRGEQVMIDRDLATNFRFQLLKVEYDNLKSQLVTSSWGGVRTLPYAFTEHGVAMLSAVLRSEVAIKVSIQQCSTSHVRFLLIDEKELYHIVEANEMVSFGSGTERLTDHFEDFLEMITTGKTAQRQVESVIFSRNRKGKKSIKKNKEAR